MSAVTKGPEASIDMSIMGFISADISMSILPPCLADKQLLPDLVFLTLEALSNLITHHTLRIKEWVAAGLIHRIVIDEIHTVHGECFRTVCQILPRIVSLKIPVIAVSGSLPKGFRNHLLCHLGMCSMATPDHVNLVEDEDLLGDFPTGFQLTMLSKLHRRQGRF